MFYILEVPWWFIVSLEERSEPSLEGSLRPFRLSSNQRNCHLALYPAQVGGRRTGIGMKSRSQMAVSSMGKKTFKGKWTTVACVSSHIYL